MPPERMKGGIHAAGTERADAEPGEPGLGVSGDPLWGGAQHGTGGGDAESLHRTVPGAVYPGGPGPGGDLDQRHGDLLPGRTPHSGGEQALF